jgi:hypothetical protein
MRSRVAPNRGGSESGATLEFCPSAGGRSTCLIETDETTWRRAGFAATTAATPNERLQELANSEAELPAELTTAYADSRRAVLGSSPVIDDGVRGGEGMGGLGSGSGPGFGSVGNGPGSGIGAGGVGSGPGRGVGGTGGGC